MPKPITVDAASLPALAWTGARYIATILGTVEAVRQEPAAGAAVVVLTAAWALYREARRHAVMVRLADALPNSLAVVRRPGYDGGVNPTTRRDQSEMSQPPNVVQSATSAAALALGLPPQSDAPQSEGAATQQPDAPMTTGKPDLDGHAAAMSAAAPAILSTAANATGLPPTHPGFWLYAARLMDVISGALAPAFNLSRSSNRTALAVSLGVGLADSAAHAFAGQ